MNNDVALYVAVLSLIGTLYAAWSTHRSERSTASVENRRVDVEIVRYESERMEAILARLDKDIARLEERNDELNADVNAERDRNVELSTMLISAEERERVLSRRVADLEDRLRNNGLGTD